MTKPNASEVIARHGLHRPDIDGLRAVAVLSVLAYHFWGGLVSGGFIGVDVFFVISGYLLSAIITAEVQAGNFSLGRFYERRIRRIFPALFALLAFCGIFASLFLLPPDVASFGSSMLAASLSVSNFYFQQNSNYFDAPAAVRPLLHTWSLAVEEQFYVVLPIFIVVIQRYLPKYMRVIVVSCAIASFVWSVVDVRLDPGAAFFLPFTRAWELLLGTILALRIIPVPRARILRECLSAFGILAILRSLLVLTVNTPFPGEHALLPCLASGAIILAGEEGETLAGRLLSQRPVVFIGLISYSLYLWHWPLLVFSKIAVFKTLDVPASGTNLLLAVMSIAIAAASWWFVETPFRTGRHRPDKRLILVFGATCIPIFVASALVLSSTRGLTGRFPPSARAVADYLDYAGSHPNELRTIFGTGSCYLDRRQAVSDFRERECMKAIPGKQAVLIFGDSHAANLRSGLESSNPKISFLQATSSSCPPTLTQNRSSTPECKRFVNKVLYEYIPQNPINFVLLAAKWNSTDLNNLKETVDFLHRKGVTVIVFGPLPVYDTDLPRLLAKSITRGEVDYARKHLSPKQQALDDEMSRMAAERWHVPYVSPLRILCPNGKCVEYVAQDVPLEFDMSHLTLQGSEYLGQEVSIKFPHIFERGVAWKG